MSGLLEPAPLRFGLCVICWEVPGGRRGEPKFLGSIILLLWSQANLLGSSLCKAEPLWPSLRVLGDLLDAAAAEHKVLL